MLIAVDALNRHLFQPLLDDMFRLRARVFADRMGWQVTVENGMEVDKFDRLDPAYLIGLDEDLNVISCARLLQTTGPHMLSDVFHAILDGEPPLRSATIWESTRFCVDTERLNRSDSKAAISRAMCELLIGMNEYAQDAGVRDIITVIDPVMNRVLKRSDCAPHGYVGKTVPMGRVSAMAALLDCTDERAQRVRNFAGIQGDVFLSEDAALARLAARAIQVAADEVLPPTISLDDLRTYFVEQLEAAKDEAERRATERLINHLADGLGSREETTHPAPRRAGKDHAA
jgi:N-acyl-L-homoserine lactone synthetase